MNYMACTLRVQKVNTNFHMVSRFISNAKTVNEVLKNDFLLFSQDHRESNIFVIFIFKSVMTINDLLIVQTYS